MNLQLKPGESFYLGYHDWAVHPDEAAVILTRGHVIVNGVPLAARQVDEIGRYPVIRITGLDAHGDPSDPQAPACSHVGALSECRQPLCQCTERGASTQKRSVAA